VLNIDLSHIEMMALPGTTIHPSFTVSEETGDSTLHAVSIYCTHITAVHGLIPGTSVTFDTNNFDLTPGGSQLVTSSISIPDDFRGTGTGSIIVESTDGGTRAITLSLSPPYIAGVISNSISMLPINGASVYLQRPNGSGGWENVPTGEALPIAIPDTNPLVTGADGKYQWGVLLGSYRLHVEASNYYPTDSLAVDVPTSVTDFNVGLTPKRADLSLTKSVDLESVMAEKELTYLISVTNEGPDDATGVKVNENLPVGVTYISSNTHGKGSYNTGVWTIGNLSVNESATLSLIVTVDAGTHPGTITNTATISGNQTDPHPLNNAGAANTTVINPVPSISVWGVITLMLVFGGLIFVSVQRRRNNLL
jgi:uncharacterized repeat protein (TIGR01451 family)